MHYDDLLYDIEKDISENWENIKGRNYVDERINFYNSVHSILDEVIALNIQNRKDKSYQKNALGLINYLQEYCTVIFDIGRQTGKTEWIKRRLSENDVVVVINQVRKKEFISSGIDERNILSCYDILHNNYNWMQYKNIYMNDASYMYRHFDRNHVYQSIGNSNVEQTFILLG